MTDSAPGTEPVPVTDPLALRAIAHPLRVRLLDALLLLDSATATELAEAVGDTAANCSWHLRQLAKYHFIEEAPGGTGRQRPWRRVQGPRQWGPDADTEATIAADAASAAMIDHEIALLRDWPARRAAEPPQWRNAAAVSQIVQWLTPDEMAELNRAFYDLIVARMDRLADPAARPEGARPVRVVAWTLPAEQPRTTPATGDATRESAGAEDESTDGGGHA